MNHQKIDRLFREKLDQMEVPPSKQAWEEVNRQIGNKKSNAFIWMAAAIVPILIGSYFLLVAEPELTPVASIDHPTSEKTTMTPIVIEDPEGYNPKVAITQKSATSTYSKPTLTSSAEANTVLVAKDETSIQETLESTETPAETLAVENMVADITSIDAPEEEPLAVEKEISYSPIKITYKAGKTQRELIAEKVEADSISTFKKLIAMADNFSPVEVISELKTAKDQLLSGGSRNKKDKNSL